MPDRGDGRESCRPRRRKRRRALSPSCHLGERGNPAGGSVGGAYAAGGGEPSERGHSAETPAGRRACGYLENSITRGAVSHGLTFLGYTTTAGTDVRGLAFEAP